MSSESLVENERAAASIAVTDDLATGRRDTIAAIATPPGRGGIGIVRLSGPRVRNVATTMLGRLPPPRRAQVRSFRDVDGQVIDHGLALYFPAPGSYTGEDVLELHGHGGTIIMELVLEQVLQMGVRLARPGEFSERAFLEGRMDLAQAEAVADLIEASSVQAARAAQASLRGEFSRRVHALTERLTSLRVHVEGTLDFPDEEIDQLADDALATSIETLIRALAQTRDAAAHGCRLIEGLRVVIAGPANAGKSCILNRLAGDELAIVTAVPGTTRDSIREQVRVRGATLELTDTAGLRASEDPVESIGIERAKARARACDLVLLVVDDRAGACDASDDLISSLPAATDWQLVRNKIDLTGATPGFRHGALYLSALTGMGFEHLEELLSTRAGARHGEGAFSARRRHIEALEDAASALVRGASELRSGGAIELVAEDLRHAQQALGGITGTVSSDDLLARIFSTFCLGK